jgi:hypothetical protein
MIVFLAFLTVCFGAGLLRQRQADDRPLRYVVAASLLLCVVYYFLQVL